MLPDQAAGQDIEVQQDGGSQSVTIKPPPAAGGAGAKAPGEED